ncbi:TRAM/LAG1/CLN8 homology domain-containing protein [Cynara cardunculus var. scolymus]|uniref:TRAM/LAG1/CLN8 homology domain-containing protein n=1 Tax=Cynara cardunculus var. scolymus TaxID=59895 RepID=A0A118JWG2_CYNCS|nr:TRAM/LAG1/CLN8 homology domain-containing protein [Cynara cardunculus var. scolymus]
MKTQIQMQVNGDHVKVSEVRLSQFYSVYISGSKTMGTDPCPPLITDQGIITPLVFKGFIKLSNAHKLEWKNRGFSTFHALFVVVASFYFLLISDLFDEHVNDGLIIKRRSTLSDTILGMSSGYFLSDMAMIIWTYPTLGGLEYVLHHGLSMFAITQSVLSGEAEMYIFMVLFTESTTPFVNIRWYLDVAGMKASKLYLWNGIAMFLGWLVARILLFGFFFYHIYNHIDEVRQVHTAAFYSLHIIPPVLAVMNLFWFFKIAKGMVRTLRKKTHSHTS